MAEEHKADPWRGGDDGQSWQPSHIERGAADQEQETGASANQTDSAQVPATEEGDQQTRAWDQRPTTPIAMSLMASTGPPTSSSGMTAIPMLTRIGPWMPNRLPSSEAGTWPWMSPEY